MDGFEKSPDAAFKSHPWFRRSPAFRNSVNCHSCESRNLFFSRLSGFPLEFTPYMIRGGNDKVALFFKALAMCFDATMTAPKIQAA
jgi:hypothetical protein